MVADWSAYLKKDLAKMLVKKKIGKTGSLASSIKYNITYDADGPSKVTFYFNHYGKFVDMGIGRGQKIGDVKGNTEILRAAGLKGRVAKKWYTKTIFPEANTLAVLLKENYGIKAIEIINDIIDGAVNMNM
jgi:hypothetical protein